MYFLNVCLFLTALINLVAGHSVFTTLFINDVDQGDGTCVRMPMVPSTCTAPIIDLSSNDMACNINGSTGVARVCPVPQASKLTFVWREYADASQPGAIDVSHKGPCAVYMKAVTSAITDPGYGNGWFKIWDTGYDDTTSQWCTEKLIANNGLLSVNIPNDLAGGYYLVRPELLALHQADKIPPQPQFYTGCAQIFLDSTAEAVPSNTVSIPGYVQAGDPSVDFNIYTPVWPYPMPGPTVYETATSKKLKARTGSTVQTQGLKPADCVLVNANWCGIELDSYSTEDGCWNASKACFEQDSLCYSSAPPTGSKNCPVWEQKCDTIQAACNANNFTGPPDQGKNLNPATTAQYTIPAVASETATTAVETESATSFPQTSTITTSGLLSVSTYISSSAPTSQSTNTALMISEDGNCGGDSEQTCLGSVFGNCCSQYGYCGSTNPYCGEGCQNQYGTCGTQ